MPLPIYIRGNASVSDVRNRIVQDFLQTDSQLLVMCDDDVIPPDNALVNLIDGTHKFDVVAGVCLIVRPGTTHLPNVFTYRKGKGGYDIDMRVFGNHGLIQVDAVGTGLIAVQRRVLEDKHLKAPFAAQYSKDGVMDVGEDLTFCRRASARGYKIAVDMDVFCEHHVETHTNALALAYSNHIEYALGQEKEHGRMASSLPQ